MRGLFFVLLAAILILSLVPATTTAQPPETAFQRIEDAHERGEISREETIINKTLAIFDNEKLPQRFQRPETSPPVKNGTTIIRELKREFETISLEAKEKLKPYLFRGKRTVAAKLIDSTFIPANKTVLESTTLPNSRQTQNFNIEWGNSNLDTTDIDDNSYPDVIDRWAVYLEASWVKIIGLMGYTPPKDSGTHLVDVYIANTGDGSPSLSWGWYGYTNIYSEPYGVPFIVVNNDFSWANDNNDPEGDIVGAMKVTAAHEFFHTSHFAMDYWEDAWWMEATATWMEDAVYDEVNDYYNYLNSWPLYPNASLLLFNGQHEYGDVIWAKYLSEKWGGETAIKEIWDNCTTISGPSSVSATKTFFSSHLSSLPDAFKDFTVKNIFMDYEEGAQYGNMAISAEHSSYPLFIDSTSLDINSPDYLGANYIKLNAAAGLDMTVAFDGDEFFNGRAIQWGAKVALATMAGYTTLDIELDTINQSGYLTIEGYANYSAVYLIPSVLSETGITPTESSLTLYSEYPDGVPYAYEVCEDCPPPVFPLMGFNYNDGYSTSDGGFCFIATAAFGYYDEPHVMLLRKFRDRYLMTNSLGRSFVDLYYRISPGIAEAIANRQWLKDMVRALLLPAIGFSWLALEPLRMLFFSALLVVCTLLLKLFYTRIKVSG